ncbi:YdeI/OmpD-associated family protein [Dactylosporangium vinaceum]
MTMRFRAVLELNGKTATGLPVPDEVLTALGAGKKPKVTVSINGYSYRSSVGAMGGRSMLPISAEVRAGAGIAAGDTVDVDVELDAAPRTVEVPADLAAALDAEPVVRKAFDALSYSNQRAHVLSVEGAKTEATRTRRIAKVIETLS